ncbi:MAG TPA: TonB-dependent receptor [Caulobacteraceae bacterium]|nr:TonB-dependent receptor [Caulobacteraceae bacterium]
MYVRWMLGVSTLALLASAPVAAQTQAQSQSQSAQPTQVGEVIVTAEKRAENVQNVPISMVVTSGKFIKDYDIRDTRDLSVYTPDFTIAQTPGDYQVYIRGIGSGNQNFAFDQDVSTYVDGVYAGRAHQFAAPFFDLDHVEVLRGPQGALLGKNTSAGAVSITTAQPTRTFDAAATIGSEAYTSIFRPGLDAEGYVSGPISSTLSGRLAAKYLDQNGYIENRTVGRVEPKLEEALVRGWLRWDPSANLTISTKLEYGHFTDVGSDAEGIIPGLQTALTDYKYAADPFGIVPRRRTDSFNGLVHADLKLGDLTLTSITGASIYTFHDIKGGGANPVEGFLFDEGEHFQQYSEELRLTSPANRPFDYIIGAYFDYSRLSTPLDENYNLFGGFFVGNEVQQFHQTANTQSVFAQADVNFHQFTLTGSLRYTHDSKSATYDNFLVSGLPLGPPPVYVPPNFLRSSLSEDHVDPSVTLRYHPTSDIMLYATYARGSKAGGFVSDEFGLSPATFSFRPETSTNYEGGIKSSFLDHRLVLDLSVFDTIFKDLQVSTYIPAIAGVAVSNAGSASTKGAEFSGSLDFGGGLVGTAALAYDDAKYDNFPGAPCLYNNPTCNVATNNIGGTIIPFSSKWSGSAGLTYTRPLANGWTAALSGDVAFRSKYTIEADLDPASVQPTYAKLDMRLQVSSPGNLWTFAIYGRNLTNERTTSFTYIWPFGAYRVTFMDETRLVGISVTRHFH